MVRDTIKNTSISLTPITITKEGILYKGFTIPQVKFLMRELATLEHLDWELGMRDTLLDLLEKRSNVQDVIISNYKLIDNKNSNIINNQLGIIKNKDFIIDLKNRDIKSKNKKILWGGIISVSIIGLLLFK